MCFPPFSIIPHRPSLFNINTIYTDEDVIPKEIVTQHGEDQCQLLMIQIQINVQVAMEKPYSHLTKCDSTHLPASTK